jgi:hypothetical protein
MPSSTSNSKSMPLNDKKWNSGIVRANVYQLLLVLALTCGSIEAGMWWYTHKESRYVRTFEGEYSQTLSLKHGDTTKTVLIAGNSTLRLGVNADALRSRLGAGYQCEVLAIESTTYPDWYFGLKELFRRGAQPDYVVLILPANNILELFPLSDFSAYYLVGAKDIFSLAIAENLRATATSTLFINHFSAFYSSRAALRLAVKRVLFPGFENMASKYMKQSNRRPPAVASRMRELKALCDRNKTTLVFVVPPTNRPDKAAASEVLAQAREAQLAAAMPISDTALTADYYSDGFHLNSAGRDLFTEKLATYLRNQLLSQRDGPIGGQAPSRSSAHLGASAARNQAGALPR